MIISFFLIKIAFYTILKLLNFLFENNFVAFSRKIILNFFFFFYLMCVPNIFPNYIF